VKSRFWLKALLPLLVLVALTAAISAPVYYQRIMNPTTDDYDAHIVFTLRMLKRELPPTFIIAHPLLELVIGFIYWAGRGHIGLYETAALVQVLAQVAAALVLYFWIGKIQTKWGQVGRIFLAVTLTIVAPVMILALVDGLFYFGYIGLASYHNPTVHMLRPFALLSFYFSVRAFAHPKNPYWMVALAGLCMLAGMLTKPNYGIALLPGLGVLALWFLLRRRPLDWWMLIAGQVIPCLAVLALQAKLIYMLPDAQPVGLMIAPFAVEAHWSNYLPFKFLLSILFPLAVAALTWKSLRKNDEMILAWLVFLFSVIQLYFLAETGMRFADANFRWGAQIALFILFAASLRSILKRENEEPLTWAKRWPIYGLYLLHLAAGIAYYIYAFVQPGYG